ncbi:hypothetical protein IHE45_15G043100 [Dioscorea alata]|uniref:Uncharacterized protein n=1 Tax=Dioscorea alata TaxID=55571 RepID=A0ACB7UKX3_DIOAL|nr:hypothetical protein IHE45_15G043100 [Dioscorea alata]
MCSSAPDRGMWLSLDHKFRLGLNGKIEHLRMHLHRPRTMRSPLSFLGLEKIAINRIFLILPSRKEEKNSLRHPPSQLVQWDVPIYLSFEVSRVVPGGSHPFFFHPIGVISQRLAMDGLATLGKRIEETSDSFMHTSLALGGWMSNCPDDNDGSTQTKRWVVKKVEEVGWVVGQI